MNHQRFQEIDPDGDMPVVCDCKEIESETLFLVSTKELCLASDYFATLTVKDSKQEHNGPGGPTKDKAVISLSEENPSTLRIIFNIHSFPE